MPPVTGGRFCDKCQKKVYDLTSGEPLPDLLDEAPCGRISQQSTQNISFDNFLRKQRPFTYFLIFILLLFTKIGRSQSNKDVDIKDAADSQSPADSIGKKINISGVLTDKKTKESIPFANVIAYDKSHNQLGACITDMDGNYSLQLNNVSGKSISIKATYIGYVSMQINDIPLNSLKKTINIKLDNDGAVQGLMIIGAMEYSTPLTDPFGSGTTIINRQDYLHHPKG